MRRLGMVLLAILFLFMVFAGPATQKADAVVVSTVVIGAVIAAMAAAGIGLTVSGMSSAQLQDWVSGKLNDWATDIGGSVQDHIDNNLITVTGRGIISIGTAAAQGISSFISWLKTEDSISDNTTSTAYESLSYVNGYSVMQLPTPYYYAKDDYGNDIRQLILPGSGVSDRVYCYVKTDGTITVFSHETDTIRMQNGTNPIFTGYLVGSYNGWYYYSGFYKVTSGSMSLFTSVTHNVSFSTLVGSQTDVEEGGQIDYTTQTITAPTIAQGDKWFLDVGAAPGTTVDTVTDGVIADTIDGSLTVSGEVAEEEPEFVVDEPIGVSGLTEIFPFCIPFDVYALLSCLSAEPQIPVFTARFVIPGVINQEFTIDLSPFSTIAQIVRTMELIAFAIGLALVTRERFLRS